MRTRQQRRRRLCDRKIRAARGLRDEVFLLAEPESVKGDALTNMRLYASMGGTVVPAGSGHAGLSESIGGADLVVDAIFGTGLSKEVGGVESAVIDEINRSGKIVISVDIPSGLDGLRGVPLGNAVQSDPYIYLWPSEAGAPSLPRRNI